MAIKPVLRMLAILLLKLPIRLLFLDQNNSKINTHALFANYSSRQSKSFNFDIGMRANYYSQLNTFRLEPRILIVKNLSDNLKIQASGEIKNQIIYQIDETVFSDLSLENKLWRLSNGKKLPFYIVTTYRLVHYIIKMGGVLILIRITKK